MLMVWSKEVNLTYMQIKNSTFFYTPDLPACLSTFKVAIPVASKGFQHSTEAFGEIMSKVE